MKTKVIFEHTGENMEAIREEVIVNGKITKDGFAVMMAATNGDGTFVPAVVGLHEVNAADEAVYAKLVGIEPCEANLIAACSADVLVGRFVNASDAWDELPVKGQTQSGAVHVGIPFAYGLYNFTPVRNGVNKKISWWISRQGIGHALYCFTSNYTAEIGYQFQHISSYISMFEAQFGTIDGKQASVQIPAGGRNVDAMRFKVYPNVGPAYIVEVPSGEVDNIDEWLSEHMESDATFVELKSTDSTSKNTSSDENADIRVRDICGDKCQCYVYYDKASGQDKMRFWLRAAFPRPADMIEVRTALKANFGSGAGTFTYDDGSFDVIIEKLVPFAFSNADLENFADNAVTLIENVLHTESTSVSWNAGHRENDDDALLTEAERKVISDAAKGGTHA